MKEIDELVKQLYIYAHDQKNLIVREFIAMQGMSQNKFTTLLTRYPDLLEAYHYARLMIGIRREKKALENEINASVYKDSQPLYDDDLKAWEIEKKKGSISIDDGLKKLEIIYAKALHDTSTQSDHIDGDS
jgi:hypothetical protein